MGFNIRKHNFMSKKQHLNTSKHNLNMIIVYLIIKHAQNKCCNCGNNSYKHVGTRKPNKCRTWHFEKEAGWIH